MNISTFADLERFFNVLPDGTTCDRLPGDLQTGNFDEAHFETPDGESITVLYTGEWREETSQA